MMSDKNSIRNSFYLVHGQPEGCLLLEDIYLVSSSGIVLDKSGNIVKEVLDEHIFWLPTTMPSYGYTDGKNKFLPEIVKERLDFLEYHAKETRSAAAGTGKLSKLEDEILWIDLTHPFGWYAYGHLHDSLQRIYSIREIIANRPRDTIGFIISSPARVSDFKEHLSALLGWDSKETILVEARRGEVYQIKKYAKPAVQSVYTNFTSDVYRWLRSGYDNYFSTPNKQALRTRLYLSRNHVQIGRRGVLNEI